MSPFEMFSPRPLSDPIDTLAHSIAVPPVYRVFIETFLLGKDKILRPSFLPPDDKSTRTCATYLFKIEEADDVLELYDMFSMNEILQAKSRLNKDEVAWKKQMLPIGYGSLDMGIWVGTQAKDLDRIYIQRHGDLLIDVADNIFSFIRGFEYTPLEELFIKPYKFDQLYKNWGDDVWKIRQR